MRMSNSPTSKLLSLIRSVVFLYVTAIFLTLLLFQPSVAFAAETPPSFADLADKVKHAVVNIATTQVIKKHPMQPFMGPDSRFREFFGDDFFKRFFGDIPQGEMKTHALGSGFVIDKEGHILTNNHVVEKATEIKVKIQSGKEYDVTVVGRDPKTDLALIKAKPDGDFPAPALLGDSDAIRAGDWVMAVGNPFGLGHTVTVGIISATGRVIGAGPYDDFLQTDAAINPGNSGGPLFNMQGEVVGINSAIVAQGQGIGFAIPVNMAKELLPQLKSGKVIRGWLGVMIQDLTPDLAKSFGLKEEKGVLISNVVEDGPAAKAGLKRGDVVLKFDSKEVQNAHDLSFLVANTQPDSKLVIAIIRDGKEKDIKVKIGTMPEEAEQEFAIKEEAAWGLTVQELTPQLAENLGLEPKETGVLVSGIEPGSAAAEAGLRRGDVIKEVNRKEIKKLNDYNEALKEAKEDESLLLLIRRGSGTLYVVLKPANQSSGG